MTPDKLILLCQINFQWSSGGGFSVDASVQIDADGCAGLERLLRYCARPPLALERLEAIDAQRLMYHLPKPRPDVRTDSMLTPLEFIDRLAALISPPHTHRHRYHGVLAPNAKLRAAVTALAREAPNSAQQQTDQEKKDTEDAVEAVWRSPTRYLGAMLLARIYESEPLACPQYSCFLIDVPAPALLTRTGYPPRQSPQSAVPASAPKHLP